jgi:hypothetical protein
LLNNKLLVVTKQKKTHLDSDGCGAIDAKNYVTASRIKDQGLESRQDVLLVI